jgi:hypothetical protein
MCAPNAGSSVEHEKLWKNTILFILVKSHSAAHFVESGSVVTNTWRSINVYIQERSHINVKSVAVHSATGRHYLGIDIFICGRWELRNITLDRHSCKKDDFIIAEQ